MFVPLYKKLIITKQIEIMDKKKVYIATIQIAFYADNEDDACDAVSACLSENLTEAGAILDWQYIPESDGEFSKPEFHEEIDPENYNEGDIFY